MLCLHICQIGKITRSGEEKECWQCRLSFINFENGNLDFNCVGILCVGNNYISMLKLIIARLSDWQGWRWKRFHPCSCCVGFCQNDLFLVTPRLTVSCNNTQWMVRVLMIGVKLAAMINCLIGLCLILKPPSLRLIVRNLLFRFAPQIVLSSKIN